MKAAFSTTFTMGDFSAEEARTFFFEYIIPSFPSYAAGASEAWGRVHKACGGNPGLLRKVAIEASMIEWDWDGGA